MARSERTSAREREIGERKQTHDIHRFTNTLYGLKTFSSYFDIQQSVATQKKNTPLFSAKKGRSGLIFRMICDVRRFQ